MSRSVLIVGLALILGISLEAVSQKHKESERTKTRRALVEMEHAFAKAAATKGTRDAFIEFLADDGMVFQPGPVNGKKFWTDRERRKGLLRIGSRRNGRHGYTGREIWDDGGRMESWSIWDGSTIR